jgi:hypothetical protein
MGLKNRLAIVAAISLALANSAKADWHVAADAMLACYGKAAIKIGSETCQPPPALVGAVFGECSDAETTFRQSYMAWSSDNTEGAQGLLDDIHHAKTPEIEAVILRAQTQRRKCP